MKKTLLAVSLVVASAGATLADDKACTQETITAKTQELSTAMQKIATSNPARLQEISTVMQEKTVEAQSSGDMSGLCAYYDEIIKEANS